MRLILFCLFGFSLSNLSFNDSNLLVRQNVSVQVEGKPVLVANPTLVLIFTEHFSDSIKIIVGKKVISNDFFVTNESNTVANEFIFENKELKKMDKIIIQKRLNGKIIKSIIVPVKKGYACIRITKDGKKWGVTYTNKKIYYE